MESTFFLYEEYMEMKWKAYLPVNFNWGNL